MKKKYIYDIVRNEIAEELGISKAKITESSSFVNDLEADSLDIFQINMRCEEEFGIGINNQTGYMLVTVGDLVDFIDSRLKKQEGIA